MSSLLPNTCHLLPNYFNQSLNCRNMLDSDNLDLVGHMAELRKVDFWRLHSSLFRKCEFAFYRNKNKWTHKSRCACSRCVMPLMDTLSASATDAFFFVERVCESPLSCFSLGIKHGFYSRGSKRNDLSSEKVFFGLCKCRNNQKLNLPCFSSQTTPS